MHTSISVKSYYIMKCYYSHGPVLGGPGILIKYLNGYYAVDIL